MTRALPNPAERRLTPRLARTLLVLSGLCAGAAYAHEGHVHGDAADAGAVLAPRLTLSTARFEAVALRNGSTLDVYVDDYASNRPLAGLRVSLHRAGGLIQAREDEPGLYRLDLEASPEGPAPAALAVDLSLSGPGIEARLQGELPAAPAGSAEAGAATPAPAADGRGVPGPAGWLVGAAGLLLALVANRGFLGRRRDDDATGTGRA